MNDKMTVINVSAEALPEPGVRPTRTLQRDPLGKFSSRPLPHREPTMVRDSVSGQMLQGEDRSVLVRQNDGLAEERLHRMRPDYSSHPSMHAHLGDGGYPHHLRRQV